MCYSAVPCFLIPALLGCGAWANAPEPLGSCQSVRHHHLSVAADLRFPTLFFIMFPLGFCLLAFFLWLKLHARQKLSHYRASNILLGNQGLDLPSSPLLIPCTVITRHSGAPSYRARERCQTIKIL
jgi:hypothetical protein